jgi:hypothetical protein
MAYDWGTRLPGVRERHADSCPFSDGEMCTCGPLGYTASIEDPATGMLVSSPLLETEGEARAWRREQEWAVGSRLAANANGNGNGNGNHNGNGNGYATATGYPTANGNGRATVHGNGAVRRATRVVSEALDREPETVAMQAEHDPGPARARLREQAGRTARVARTAQTRGLGPPPRQEPPQTTVSTLIDRFLDAAEDGEARNGDGRPYSDEELAEREWALSGYVDGHLGELDVGAVRGRHVFRLIDELEDAGMPRARLRSVVGAVRELFDYATDLDLVRANPATYVSLPADDRPRRRLPETAEMPAPAASRLGAGFGDNLVSEQTIWMLVKIVTLVFICIALVLVAESV